MGADIKFLANLKEKCAMSDKQWEERQKERHVELEAVAKAISILSSDDARDQFSKTFNPSFLQVSRENQQRKQAADALSKFPKFAALATAVRLDPFTDVKKAIDKMVAALEKESAEEVKHKDYCISELRGNEKSTQK